MQSLDLGLSISSAVGAPSQGTDQLAAWPPHLKNIKESFKNTGTSKALYMGPGRTDLSDGNGQAKIGRW